MVLEVGSRQKPLMAHSIVQLSVVLVDTAVLTKVALVCKRSSTLRADQPVKITSNFGAGNNNTSVTSFTITVGFCLTGHFL